MSDAAVRLTSVETLNRSLTKREYETYLPLVRSIAIRAARRVPSHVSVDDLVGYGWVGLLEAFGRARKGIPAQEFQAYASHRVRGAMLDYLRACDPTARDLRRKARAISRAVAEIVQSGAEATDEAVAGTLGYSVTQYRDMVLMLERVGVTHLAVVDIDATEIESPNSTPDELAQAASIRTVVTRAIESLPDRLRQVLALYYTEECTLREIGEVLGVSESRASQLHSEAMTRLRAQIRG